MQVLVDTTVWSLAFRRNARETTSAVKVISPALQVLRDLVADGRAALIGAIRQELLSGIKSHDQFFKLSQAMAAFDDLVLSRADFELAAEFFNNCRSKGVQGSNTDFLICAAASARKLPILTTDQDFGLYAKHLPINLLVF